MNTIIINNEQNKDYENLIKDVIEKSKNNIVAIKGKEGCGKEYFFNSLAQTINSSNQTKQKEQCVFLQNTNTDTFISTIINKIFNDQLSTTNKKDNKIVNTFLQGTNLEETKTNQFKKDIQTVTNVVSSTDYNKLQRKYTIISLVASMLASLGTSIFILGCTNLRYLGNDGIDFNHAYSWGQTLGLIIPGIIFIITAWFLFFLYYKNYKKEKNMPMNIDDQSAILLNLLKSIAIEKSHLTRFTFSLFKALDLRNYLAFKKNFLNKEDKLPIIKTTFIIDNFSSLNIDEQLALLKSMSVLNNSIYLNFVVFLSDEGLIRLGDEQTRKLHKYLSSFVYIKYDIEVANNILKAWVDEHFLPSDEKCNWFNYARQDIKFKILNDFYEISFHFCKEINSYKVLMDFLNDLNNYFNQVNLIVQYLNPLEIFVLYVLKYTKNNIYNFILENGSVSLNFSFDLSEYDDQTKLLALNQSSSLKDHFLYALVSNSLFLSHIKAFDYLFKNVTNKTYLLTNVAKSNFSSLYKKYYSIVHLFDIFLNPSLFQTNLTTFIEDLKSQTFDNVNTLFHYFLNLKSQNLFINTSLFDHLFLKQIQPKQCYEFAKTQLKVFLDEEDLIYIFNHNDFSYARYLNAIVKIYALSVIYDNDVILLQLQKFNDLKTSNEDLILVLNNLIKNNPDSFYDLYLMQKTIKIDQIFFISKFSLNNLNDDVLNVFNYIIQHEHYLNVCEMIKNTSIDWNQHQFSDYGFVWLNIYLQHTKDDVILSTILQADNSYAKDVHLITYILLDYESFKIVPNVVPFKHANLLFKDSFDFKEILIFDAKNIFSKQLKDNLILNYKIGQVYYALNLQTNTISHVYATEIAETYGSM